MVIKYKVAAACATLVLLAGCSNLTINTPSSSASNSGSQPSVIQASENANKEKDKKALAQYDGKPYKGVKINGVDVGGKTEQEIKDLLQKEFFDKVSERNLQFSYNGISDYMSYFKLKVGPADETIKEAINAGKGDPVKQQLKYVKDGYPKNVELKMGFDEKHMDAVIEDVRRFILSTSTTHAAEMVDGKVVLKKDATQDVLDVAKFKTDLIAAMTLNPEDNEPVKAVINKEPVTIKQEDLDQINERLTSFSTDYSWSPAGRWHNVELSASSINGSLVMPGEEFSFNATVGPTTAERGYQDAGVYSGDKLIQEPGGGACQVSSTLYNAVIEAGITPTQRENHGMVVGYLPYGMDCVVYDPWLDLKFVNTFDTPIFITSSSDEGTLTFSIYGNENAMGGYTYTFTQDIYETIPAQTVVKEDPSLPQGYSKHVTSAYDGYKVKVYRQTYLNGQEVSNELYTDNEYRKVDDVTVVGTGDPATTPWPQEDDN